MIKFRFLIVALIIIITGIVLQTLKLIDFSNLFRKNYQGIDTEYLLQDLESAEEIPEDIDEYLLIHSSESELSQLVRFQTEQVLRNSRTQFTLIDLTMKEERALLLNSDPGDMLIYTLPKIGYLTAEEREFILDLVEAGASLTLLTTIDDLTDPFSRMTGIEKGAAAAETVEERTFYFTEFFFPMLDELYFADEDTGDYRIRPSLSYTAAVYAEYKDEIPMIWRSSSGDGSILFTNSTLFSEKLNRGLLQQLLLVNDDYGISYMISDAVLSIQDFPAPLPEEPIAEIFDDYQRDTKSFFRDIWWADISTYLKKYRFGVTGYISLYPRQFNEGETKITYAPLTVEVGEAVKSYGKLLGGAKGELGVQILNYPEREVAVTEPWNALQEIFPNLIFTSLSASEDLLGNGELELFPFEVTSGFYTQAASGKYYHTGLPIIELDGSDIGYTIPSFSSGYSADDQEQWAMVNGIAELGFFNHTITPFAVIDDRTDREKRWGLKTIAFEQLLQGVEHAFPFLEQATVSEAAYHYQLNENLKINTKREGEVISIYLEEAFLPQKFFFRSAYPIKRVEGGILRPLGRSNLYTLVIRNPFVRISVSLD